MWVASKTSCRPHTLGAPVSASSNGVHQQHQQLPVTDAASSSVNKYQQCASTAPQLPAAVSADNNSEHSQHQQLQATDAASSSVNTHRSLQPRACTSMRLWHPLNQTTLFAFSALRCACDAITQKVLVSIHSTRYTAQQGDKQGPLLYAAKSTQTRHHEDTTTAGATQVLYTVAL
jgi:hypothetical protein